jgi:hypothetical protein
LRQRCQFDSKVKKSSVLRPEIINLYEYQYLGGVCRNRSNGVVAVCILRSLSQNRGLALLEGDLPQRVSSRRPQFPEAWTIPPAFHVIQPDGYRQLSRVIYEY